MALQVLLIWARGLIAADAHSSDPIAHLTCGGGERISSSVAAATTAPTWNQSFAFPCAAPNTPLSIIIEDHDTLANDFLGAATLTAGEFRYVDTRHTFWLFASSVMYTNCVAAFAHARRRWCQLRRRRGDVPRAAWFTLTQKNGKTDKPRGDVQIAVRWCVTRSRNTHIV